jgi:diaminopimelate decarboxylase/aspartate kinase
MRFYAIDIASTQLGALLASTQSSATLLSVTTVVDGRLRVLLASSSPLSAPQNDDTVVVECGVRFIVHPSMQLSSTWTVLATLAIDSAFLENVFRGVVPEILFRGAEPLVAVFTPQNDPSKPINMVPGTPDSSDPSTPINWFMACASSLEKLYRDHVLDAPRGDAPDALYVYDLTTVEQQAKTVLGLVKPNGPLSRAFYACKANPHPAILHVLYTLGFGFECVSWNEVRTILGLFPEMARTPDRILFTPNFAPQNEYAYALKAGVHVTLDNGSILDEFPALFSGANVLLRIDPGVGAGHHAKVKTAGTASKFGIPLPEVEAVLGRCTSLHINVVGLHAHVGSGIRDAHWWLQTLTVLSAIAESHPSIRILDLGGGLGVESTDYLSELNDVLRHVVEASPRLRQLELWMEPGRFLVSDAGILLAHVTQTKRKGDAHGYVGVSTGMNSLIRPALYGAKHRMTNISKLGKLMGDAKLGTLMGGDVDVVGPICETGDVLGHAVEAMGDAQRGDVVAVANGGAYGRAMSSYYNLRAPAREIVVRRVEGSC